MEALTAFVLGAETVTRDFFALFAAPNESRKKSDGNESWHFHPPTRTRMSQTRMMPTVCARARKGWMNDFELYLKEPPTRKV